MSSLAAPGGGLVRQPHWYKDAVIYELRTRSFFDSNGDGVGDLPGLTSQLPYLHDLGVTALWLLPLCPSPGRDDGYDIADYTDVHPEVGTLDDFRTFVQEAHRHGLRVITELVMNHTSDVHPWFQRARRAAPGSVERDFYVWSERPDRYREARIIFKDFEPSNWAWDPIANAYYWHRFFAHQPDLNFENPAVHAALFDVVDFWFDMGVDGLRLDAVPYLYEEEGTNCENLPKTHAFLKQLRAHVDAKFEDRMLLAEANQWPEDAAAYFGEGDECHMNFHFPLMPRMFMALHMEDRFPLVDIMAQTPQLEHGCQWAMFLRNHDELTLEMVTDEERDYMYRAYAHEPSMRINLGIRRRLAPLVGNDRRKIELLNGLLFSLPGTPVVYYGDEIGMGDNVFLGDRNGVRTPMQWTCDRSAGFSRANPQRLILPVIIDPEYHFETLNVESQQNNGNSLLWWTKRLIALRKRYSAFGWGSIEFLAPNNARVLAFIREHGEQRILVVANLSRFVQYAELDLSKFKGLVPMELFGRNAFPQISEAPYLVTLGGHAFYWFALEASRENASEERASLFEPPILESASLATLASGTERGQLEELLSTFLQSRPWFRGRERVLIKLSILQVIQLAPGPDGMQLCVLRVDYNEGDPETYALPLTFVADSAETKLRSPRSIVATLRTPEGQGKVIDALEEIDASRPIIEAILRRAQFRAGSSLVAGVSSVEEQTVEAIGAPTAVGTQYPNTTLQFGDRYFLKVLRHLDPGISPDYEVGRFLSIQAPELSPPVLGALELRHGRAEPITLAILQRWMPNEGTAWVHARRELGRYYERVLSRTPRQGPTRLAASSLVTLALEPVPAIEAELIGVYNQNAELLGKRTAQMHLALADGSRDASFAPESHSTFDRRSAYQTLRNQVGRVLRMLRFKLHALPERGLPLARELLAREQQLLARFEPMLQQSLRAKRIRTHGDYHLNQALWTGKDFIIIDFDGGHRSTLIERRRKRSALRDVAGMVRSFHYAAYAALLDGVVREADREEAEPWANVWQAYIAAAFFRGYRDTVGDASFLPGVDELSGAVDRSILARAVSELGWELAESSPRVLIPLQGLVHLLAD